jgi:integrase
VKRSVLVVPAIEGAKTKQARTIPISKEALAIIKRWRPEDDSPLFPKGKPNLALKAASARAKMGAVLTPRDLRAFFITHAGKRDVRAAQSLAGHTSIATTSRYLHADERRILAAARAAAEAAAPTRRSPQKKQQRRKAE